MGLKVVLTRTTGRIKSAMSRSGDREAGRSEPLIGAAWVFMLGVVKQERAGPWLSPVS